MDDGTFAVSAVSDLVGTATARLETAVSGGAKAAGVSAAGRAAVVAVPFLQVQVFVAAARRS